MYTIIDKTIEIKDVVDKSKNKQLEEKLTFKDVGYYNDQYYI